MTRHFLLQLLYFIVLLLLQDFVIDKLPLGTYVHPELYLIFILLLPFNYPVTGVLLWAFALGLGIDLLSVGVLGLHAASLLILAYMRFPLLRLVSTKENLDSSGIPVPAELGLRPFLTYIILSAVIYFTVLCLLDSFSTGKILQLILRIICSSLVSTLLIVALQYAFTSGKKAIR